MPSHAPLSLCYVSPAWPPSAAANGVIPYIATLADELRRRGHRVSILASYVAEGSNSDDVVYDLRQIDEERGLAHRIGDTLLYRLARDRALNSRAVRALRTGLGRAAPRTACKSSRWRTRSAGRAGFKRGDRSP